MIRPTSSLIENRGPSAAIVDAWRQGRLALITSQRQLDELRDVLSRPRILKRITKDEAMHLLDHLPILAEIVEPTSGITMATDPNDNYIIGMAISGRADRIVTGDKHHLLALGNANGIPIITARQLLTELDRGKEA